MIAVEHTQPQPAKVRPARVLMTADAVGGVFRYSLDLSRALLARGVQTTLAIMGPPPSAAQRREAAHAGVPIVDREFRLEWMDEAFGDVERAGAWLLELEQTLHPDVVHLNGYAHAALPWTAPVVVVAHSCVRTWWRAVNGDAAPQALDRYTAAVVAGLEAADAVVAPTGAILNALCEEYGVDLHAEIIPNGCDERAADFDAALQRKQPLVLSAGRVWDEGKNISALCAAARLIPWPVYVAGDGRAPDGTTRPLDGVDLLGHLSHADLSEWYRRASVYALPARYEPFGLSVLEAARAGCALVLGDIPSLRENWNGAASFVPSDNRRALGAAIKSLIDDPPRRIELARRAFTRAAAFTIGRTADAYVRVYERLVA